MNFDLFNKGGTRPQLTKGSAFSDEAAVASPTKVGVFAGCGFMPPQAKWRRALFLLPFACSLLPTIGCAKSPSGGPTNVAPNRLQVTLNIRGNLAPNAFYAVAFDDDSTRRGPIAITGGSSANDAVVPLNGVVGGSFRVAIVYNANNFTVYRRPDPNSPNIEVVERSNTPFVGGLSPRASTNALNFTLDLDARASDGSFYFSHDANGVLNTTVLNLNAFATTRPFINSRDLRIKPVDALGQSTTSTPERFLIGGTRIASINDFFGDNNDRNPYDASFNNTADPDYVNFRQLDITSLDLNVTRSN